MEVLRDFLKGIADQKGDLPTSFDSKAYFNTLVKDLIQANPEKFSSTRVMHDTRSGGNSTTADKQGIVQYH